MLSERNVIYGFCKTTNPPKNKYLISLHRSSELDIVACFTTSQKRTGGAYIEKKHGKIKNSKGVVVSYFFKQNTVIGKSLSGIDFSFPEDTSVIFDYCFQSGEQNAILNQFEDIEVKCVLTDKEYFDLIYAIYQSPDTPKRFIPIFGEKLRSLE